MTKNKTKRHGSVQKKILLLLLGGLTIGLSGSPRQAFKIVHAMQNDWKKIDEATLRRSIRSLYGDKLVSAQQNTDGTQTLVLLDKGEKWALTYKMEEMVIPTQEQWDGKWRIVMFDIPERFKKARDLFRIQLRSMGFLELQRSVFIHPYPCIDEIEYITQHYHIGKYIRFVIAESIDNEKYMKKQFKLS